VQGNPSALHNTHAALLRLDELEILGSSAAKKAFEYILRVQREDGGWDENAPIAKYSPPPWARPGEPWARIYLSAQSAYWLAVGEYQSHAGFQKALDFLREHQEGSGRFEGFLHSTWIATAVFVMAGDPYSEIVDKGLEALKAKPLSEWVDSQISWALECLGRAGLPKENPFVEQSLAELIRRQGGSGEWISEDGEARTVGAIIGVLKVLKYYDMLA
jgi:hypothetical protein